MEGVILQIVMDGQSSYSEGLHLALWDILYVVSKPTQDLDDRKWFIVCLRPLCLLLSAPVHSQPGDAEYTQGVVGA
jgi:hypothetical protein